MINKRILFGIMAGIVLSLISFLIFQDFIKLYMHSPIYILVCAFIGYLLSQEEMKILRNIIMGIASAGVLIFFVFGVLNEFLPSILMRDIRYPLEMLIGILATLFPILFLIYSLKLAIILKQKKKHWVWPFVIGILIALISLPAQGLLCGYSVYICMSLLFIIFLGLIIYFSIRLSKV